MTPPRRGAPASPSQYSDSLINRFDALGVEPRTPELHRLNDPFRPPSPVGTPRTPDVTSSTTTIAPPPQLSLPPSSTIATLGKNYRPGNTATSASASTPVVYTAINPPPTSKVKVVPLSVQRHITKTVRAKQTRKVRKIIKKTVNQAWTCPDCIVHCPNQATKDAHINSRKHYLQTKYKEQKCLVCDLSFFTPEDYKRHVNGRAHRRKVNSN